MLLSFTDRSNFDDLFLRCALRNVTSFHVLHFNSAYLHTLVSGAMIIYQYNSLTRWANVLIIPKLH